MTNPKPISANVEKLMKFFRDPSLAPKDGTIIQAVIDINGEDLVYTPSLYWRSEQPCGWVTETDQKEPFVLCKWDYQPASWGDWTAQHLADN